MSLSSIHRVRYFMSVAVLVLLGQTYSVFASEAPDKAKMELGKRVFTQTAVPSCGVCHTLNDAGTNGAIGAKLEEIQPDAKRVATAVRKGLGVMPPFAGKLTEEQIEAVAYYVSIASRK